MSVPAIHRNGPLPIIRRGVTLPELLLVITIIGILSAIAVPRMWGLRDQAELRSGTTRFMRAVMATRQAAIQSGKRAYFRHENNTIWVIVDTIGNKTDSVIVQRPLNLLAEFSTTVTSPHGLITIEYDPRGIATQASQQFFYFLHKSGRQDSLCVSRLGNTIRKSCP